MLAEVLVKLNYINQITVLQWNYNNGITLCYVQLCSIMSAGLHCYAS